MGEPSTRTCSNCTPNSNACSCAESNSAPSVPLPRRSILNGDTLTSKTPPVWPLHSQSESQASDATLLPLPAKCDRHDRERSGVCCKELKGDDERSLVDPDVLRDIVIGLSDGLTVPFALTAGLASLGDSHVVVLGGIAELIAGAISMGIGGFLASQAERDHYLYLRTHTAARVKRSCEGEMEREVHGVLGPIGVDEKLSRQVAQCLRSVEEDQLGSVQNRGGLEEGGELRWSADVGLTAFLLKFGEGLEEVPKRRMYISALTIGSGYLLGGLIPLLPYFFISPAYVALIYSSIFTGIILLVFGAIKTHISGAAGGFGGYVYGAISTLCVGGFAAAAAYGIVKALET